MRNPPFFTSIKTFHSRLPRAVGRCAKIACIGIALGLALASSAKAAVIYQTDFSGSAATLPDAWVRNISGAGSMAQNGSGQLVYRGNGVGVAYWLGNADSIEGGVMTDAKITTIMQWPSTASNSGMGIGIMGRVQDSTTAGSSAGYFIGLYRKSDTSPLSPTYSLVIGKDPSLGDFGSVLQHIAFSPVVDTKYLLEATFSGSQLTANLYNEAGTSLLATITTTDATYASGVFGLRARSRQNDRDYNFDEYVVMAVPEPGSVAMLAAAGIFLGGVAARRKRRLG